MATKVKNLPILYNHSGVILPDNKDWTNRFKIPSATSDNLYTIAQHKTKRHWGCSCMGWKRYRKCKHLQELNLPILEQPYEVRIIS